MLDVCTVCLTHAGAILVLSMGHYAGRGCQVHRPHLHDQGTADHHAGPHLLHRPGCAFGLGIILPTSAEHKWQAVVCCIRISKPAPRSVRCTWSYSSIVLHDIGQQLTGLILGVCAGQSAVHGAFAGFTGITVGLVNTHYVFLPIPAVIQVNPEL